MSTVEMAPSDARRRLLRGREFGQFSATIRDLDHLSRSREARLALLAARLEITHVDPGAGPLSGHFARFPDASFAHLVIPPSSGAWTRDAASLGRASVVVVVGGEVTFTSPQPLVVRGAQIAFIPPGDAPVDFHATAGTNEIVYATVATTLLADLLPDLPVAPPPLRSPGVLAPMVAFVQQLCATPSTDAEASSALRTAAHDIARSLVRVALSGGDERSSLFDHALEIIRAEHIDPALDTAGLAHRLGVTARVLQLEFQRSGRTVSRELRNARSTTARRLRSMQPRPPAADVARFAGFGSAASMFRALRDEAAHH